jgi:phosphate uptake regulator
MAFFDWFFGESSALVNLAEEDLSFMLHQGRDIFVAATGQLLENEILEANLIEMDHEINMREQHLRSAVIEFLHSASERNLSPILKLLSIVTEAERIGDLGKSISRTSKLAVGPRLGPGVLENRDIRDEVLAIFELTRSSFNEKDVSRAEESLQRHHILKKRIADYLDELAHQKSLSQNETLVYGLSARMMGRISSHLANIASTIVYPFEQIRRTFPEQTPGDQNN